MSPGGQVPVKEPMLVQALPSTQCDVQDTTSALYNQGLVLPHTHAEHGCLSLQGMQRPLS